MVQTILNENNAAVTATGSQIEHNGEKEFVSISNDGKWTKEPYFDSPVSFICEWDYTSSCQIGDVNLDGVISIRDVTAIQRHIADLETLSDLQLVAADTNGDGKVTIDDATYLQMYLAEYDVVLGWS